MKRYSLTVGEAFSGGVGCRAWVWAVALSADGQTVAVGSANKSVLIPDPGGNLLGEHRAAADVHAVSICAKGQTIAAGSSDNRIKHITC